MMEEIGPPSQIFGEAQSENTRKFLSNRVRSNSTRFRGRRNGLRSEFPAAFPARLSKGEGMSSNIFSRHHSGLDDPLPRRPDA
jgi:hypothetical protein